VQRAVLANSTDHESNEPSAGIAALLRLGDDVIGNGQALILSQALL